MRFFLSEKRKKKQRNNNRSQETVSQLTTKCKLSHCCETQEIEKRGNNKLCVFFSDCFSICFISFDFFSFPACSFCWKNITNPDHLHVNYFVLLNFADIRARKGNATDWPNSNWGFPKKNDALTTTRCNQYNNRNTRIHPRRTMGINQNSPSMICPSSNNKSQEGSLWVSPCSGTSSISRKHWQLAVGSSFRSATL